jgi:flavodoxin/Fe-S-cluster-containing hydrogenase component 2
MRATIVYFSETWNTEKVAYAIADRLQAGGFEVSPMLYEDMEEFPEALDVELLGVGFPTFFGYAPKNFLDALEKIKKVKGDNAFVFTTYGGHTAGDSLFDAAKVLTKKGYSVLGGLKIEGSDSYPQGKALKLNEGRPNENDLKIAGEFADLLVEAHKSGKKKLPPEKLATTTPFFVQNRDRPRNEVLEELRKPVEGKIHFNEAQCLFCVTCKKSCPTRSIEEGEKFPEFTWKCIDGLRCYQCVRVCPGKALDIEYPGTLEDYKKKMALIADSPEEKKRYYIIA